MIVADKTNKINIFDISDILYIYGKYGSTIISAIVTIYDWKERSDV